jgi:hypothetical protein
MPAVPRYIIEPIWEQFCALLPERDEWIIRSAATALVSPIRWSSRSWCRSWCSAARTGGSLTRDAPPPPCAASEASDEWIKAGAMDALEGIVREAYDRIVGLELEEVAVDCCITKAPCGGEKAGRSPVDRGKRGIKRSVAVDARGIPLGIVTAPAKAATTRRCWQGHWTPLERWVCYQRERASAWMAATIRRPPARSCDPGA